MRRHASTRDEQGERICARTAGRSSRGVDMTERKPRATAADFDPEVLRLFDQLRARRASTGAASSRARAKFAVGGVSAAALLEALSPNFAAARAGRRRPIRASSAETIEFPSPQGYGKARGYLVAARRAGRRRHALPTVLVVHENRGLNPHIEDVARRLALDGLHRLRARRAVPARRLPGRRGQGARAVRASSTRPRRSEDFARRRALPRRACRGGNGKLGAVGFCWGGGMVNFLATRLPELDGGGAVLRPGAGRRRASQTIKAPLLLVFADERRARQRGRGRRTRQR